ncbi:MAG: 23S rRNA (adenine(2503)-C(2))-methyltransferase RlmN, partial [Candidatus Poribacteria bacterium]
MTQEVSTTQSVAVGSSKAVNGTVCRANLLGMDAEELGAQMIAWGQPAYRGRQVFRWLYQRRADKFEAMTDLPKSLRCELALKAELAAPVVVTRAASR